MWYGTNPHRIWLEIYIVCRAQVTIDEDKLQVEFNVQEYKPEVSISYLEGGITNNLNLGLVYVKTSFWGCFEKLRLGFELLMFYYV